MFDVFIAFIALLVFAGFIVYLVNKRADKKSSATTAPKQDVPVTTGAGHSATEIVEAYERATGLELSAIASMNVPIPAVSSAPQPKPKPKKKKAKAPAATYPNPVENVAPDGTKVPPPVNTWKM